jgi:hypothetical protein
MSAHLIGRSTSDYASIDYRLNLIATRVIVSPFPSISPHISFTSLSYHRSFAVGWYLLWK